jgi:hypothetical protein
LYCIPIAYFALVASPNEPAALLRIGIEATPCIEYWVGGIITVTVGCAAAYYVELGSTVQLLHCWTVDPGNV